jgi:hypothetical protein
MLKKALSVILAVSLVWGSIGPIVADAATTDNTKPVSVKLLEASEDKAVIETVSGSETIISKVEKTEETVKVISESSTGNVQEFVYNKGDDYFLLNGEKGEFSIEESVDPAVLKEELIKSSDINAAYPYPRYMSTTTLNFNKYVDSLNGIVTVIGGVIAVAYLAGFSFAKSEYSSNIAAWLGSIGLGTYFATKLVQGSFKVDNYRSGARKFTGCEYLWQYRYQNPRIDFTIVGKRYYKAFTKYGNWYYGQRPCA